MTSPIVSAADLSARISEYAALERDPGRVAELVLGSLVRPDEFRAIAEVALPSLVQQWTAQVPR